MTKEEKRERKRRLKEEAMQKLNSLEEDGFLSTTDYLVISTRIKCRYK